MDVYLAVTICDRRADRIPLEPSKRPAGRRRRGRLELCRSRKHRPVIRMERNRLMPLPVEVNRLRQMADLCTNRPARIGSNRKRERRKSRQFAFHAYQKKARTALGNPEVTRVGNGFEEFETCISEPPFQLIKMRP